ncbi:MAG TPA: biopolymer transporter ExbD [Candidatus Angelobacter sp.]|nr:biopolymer transporter ExbD [Candidatus Angelobacter sp.]
MAMSMGSGGGQSADINVTPLIDVLLVLLIIFMVITPLTPHGLEAMVPQPPPPNTPPKPDDRTVVVRVIQGAEGAKPKLKINQTDVGWDELGDQLTNVFKTRAERVMFVNGDPDVEFQDVARVIDIAHGTNVIDKIGLITAKIEAGE